MSAPDELFVSDHCYLDEYIATRTRTAPADIRYIRAPKADSALADELGRLILESCRCADESLAENDGKLTDFVIKNHDEIDAALRAQPGGAVPREPTNECAHCCSSDVLHHCNTCGEEWHANDVVDAATKADAREDHA